MGHIPNLCEFVVMQAVLAWQISYNVFEGMDYVYYNACILVLLIAPLFTPLSFLP